MGTVLEGITCIFICHLYSLFFYFSQQRQQSVDVFLWKCTFFLFSNRYDTLLQRKDKTRKREKASFAKTERERESKVEIDSSTKWLTWCVAGVKKAISILGIIRKRTENENSKFILALRGGLIWNAVCSSCCCISMRTL